MFSASMTAHGTAVLEARSLFHSHRLAPQSNTTKRVPSLVMRRKPSPINGVSPVREVETISPPHITRPSASIPFPSQICLSVTNKPEQALSQGQTQPSPFEVPFVVRLSTIRQRSAHVRVRQTETSTSKEHQSPCQHCQVDERFPLLSI
jgi:hypothetical protein